MADASDVLTSTTGYIESARTSLGTAVTNLNNAAAGWTAVTWTDLVAPTLGTYSAFADTDATIKSALEAFDSSLAAIVPPTLPSVPSLSSYTSPLWSETAWGNLKTLLTTFTSNITGSDDVDTVVTKLTSETTKLQVALYAKELERKQQSLRDAYSAADSSTGAKGFTYPNSMTNALKLAAQQAFQFELSDASRQLVDKIFVWAKENYQFSIGKQLDAHNADVDFNVRYANAVIQSFDSNVRGITEIYRSTVVAQSAIMDQKIKEYKVRLDVAQGNASIQAERDRIAAQLFSSLIQQHMEDVREAVNTAAANAKNRIEAAIAIVNAQVAVLSSASQVSLGVLNG